MEDRADDMMLELRKMTLAMDEKANVNMMRDGMRMMVTGIEMVNSRIGLLDLHGWSGEVCRDLDKHDANLARIYRKYWKRSTSTSPELDICMSMIGSMGMFHMKRTISKQMVNGVGGGGNGGGGGSMRRGGGAFGRRQPPQQRGNSSDESSDDEQPPGVR